MSLRMQNSECLLRKRHDQSFWFLNSPTIWTRRRKQSFIGLRMLEGFALPSPTPPLAPSPLSLLWPSTTLVERLLNGLP